MKMSSILSTIIPEHWRYQKSTGSEEDLRIAHVVTEIEEIVHPINCETSSGGYFVWENVSSLGRGKTDIEAIVIVDTPLQTLNILATDFVVQDVGDLIC